VRNLQKEIMRPMRLATRQDKTSCTIFLYRKPRTSSFGEIVLTGNPIKQGIIYLLRIAKTRLRCRKGLNYYMKYELECKCDS